MVLACHSILERMGFECRQIEPGAIGVDTPFSFEDGEVVGFYLQEAPNQRIQLTDNADTIAHFMNRGFPMEDRRRWRSISDLASTFDFALSGDGMLMAADSVDRLPSLVARYLGLMHGVMEWEISRIPLPDDVAQLADEIELHLRRRNLGIEIRRNPQITGATGRSYTFDLEADGVVIDGVTPDSKRTGAVLRKVLDVERGPSELRPLLIMDDRKDPERARMETLIISSVARVLSMTRLTHDDTPLDLAA